MTMKNAIAAIAVATLFSCSLNTGTITETDSGILGKVRYPNGSDAAGAKVQLFGARDTSRIALDFTITDPKGNYDFHTLTPGAYNIWVESRDSLLALVDSIYLPQDSRIIADATINKGSSVTAAVALQPGQDPTTFFVQALGTQRYSRVNDSGRFTIKELAQGKYTFRLASTSPGYTPTNKIITVASGVNDTLKDTITLAYSGVPLVTGIQASLNDYTGIATISWRKMTYEDFYEYKVYREEKGALNPQPGLIAISPDSNFVYDTLYRPTNPDSVYSSAANTLRAEVNYRYRVTIVTKSMDEGRKYVFADIAGKDPAGLVKTLGPGQNEKFKDSVGIRCFWNKVSTAKKYQVAISKRSDFSGLVIDTITTDTVLSLPVLGMSYYYARIRALNDGNEWGFWNVSRRFAVIGDLFKTELDMDYPNTFIQTNDGGYAIFGRKDPYIWILFKTDKSGKEVWRWLSPVISVSNAYSIVQQENGNLVVAGNENTNGNSSNSFIFMIMFNNSGEKVFEDHYWNYWNLNNDTTAFFESLINAPDNNMLLLINKPFDTSNRRHLLKIASNGGTLQDTALSFGGNDVKLFSIDKNSFMIVTYQKSDPNSFSVQLFYMDYTFKLIKKNSFSLPGACFFSNWQLCANGDLLINFLPMCNDWDLIRISAEGNVLWHSEKSAFRLPFLVRPTTDNGMIIFSQEYPSASLKRYDGKNELVWHKNIPEANIPGTCREIRENSDGTFTAIIINASTNKPSLVKIAKTGFFIDD